MLQNLRIFIRTSLVPTAEMMRLRLAPLHAYMLASLTLTFLITLMDVLATGPSFFWPMWLALHAFSVFASLLCLVALVALLVQLLSYLLFKKRWPYRQAWPFSVSATWVPTLLTVIVFHLANEWLAFTLFFYVLYIGLPFVVAKRKRQSSRSKAR